jgi:uncharacterized OB-fold protein
MTTAAQAIPPVAPPAPDADSAFYWAGLRDHQLLLQQCGTCSRFRFPPMPSCPYCASMKSSVHAARGAGTVYSWIVVRRAFDPAFAADVPYILATIDLDEGGRTVARLVGADRAAFGMRVSALYTDHPDWTELRFQPLKAS